jgi:hypothetical protein
VKALLDRLMAGRSILAAAMLVRVQLRELAAHSEELPTKPTTVVSELRSLWWQLRTRLHKIGQA